MKTAGVILRPSGRVARTALSAAGLTLGLPLATTLASAQPDYPPAHWNPAVGCTKWWTSAADAVAYYATKYGQSGPGGHYFCVVHDMEGYYEASISYLNNCSVDASIHYLVNGLQNGPGESNPSDPVAGDITQSVREAYYAWHAVCWNPYMFGTEHEGFVSNPAWFTEAMYQASAGLHRHLCDVWGIPKDRNHIIGHNEWQNTAWKTWMATNFARVNPTCNTHTDPGPYWNWTHFMALINGTTNTGGPYWDLNGPNLGAGTAPSGTWDTTSTNWTYDPAGGIYTGHWWGTNAIFAAGSDSTGSYAVTVAGVQTVNNLFLLRGAATFTGGQLNFSGSGTYFSNYVAAGCTATFNTPFGGSGSPDKWGAGTAVYNGASTSGGYYTLNEGTLALGNNAALSTVRLEVGDQTGANVVTLKSADSTPHTLANYLTLKANTLNIGAGGDLTFSGPINVNSNAKPARIIAVGNGFTTFSGVLTNTCGITKTGPGTLVLSGSGANAYGSATANGYTTVSAGTLKLSKTAGVAAIANGSLTVNPGGTLLLGAANQIADAVPMTLAGGTFQTAGFSEQLGPLTLTGNSVIDLGTGDAVVKFAASGGLAWTAGMTLTVTNWNGSVTGGGADQLVFGADGTGLTAGQVAQVWFANPAGFSPGAYSATILSTGEVVPLTVAPSITVQPSSNGQFQLSVTGVPGYNYAVLASTNLSDWTPLETNASPFTFTDAATGAYPSRFYRAQSVP